MVPLPEEVVDERKKHKHSKKSKKNSKKSVVECENGQEPEDDDEKEEVSNNDALDENATTDLDNLPVASSYPEFKPIDHNKYRYDRKKLNLNRKIKKEARRMVCDCQLTEEIEAGAMGCGEGCINRTLMIECGSRCPLGAKCSNKRFTKRQYSKVEPFLTEYKGWGLRAVDPIPADTFIMEYVGEVLDRRRFRKRIEKYSDAKREHHYFMHVNHDMTIDATLEGNVTRCINHSCDPNAQTQKWTVKGEVRVGFFTIKAVAAGEEITFDYQFQRYGLEPQKCFCGTAVCRGFLDKEKPKILEDGWNLELNSSTEDIKNKKKAKKRPIFHEDLEIEKEIDRLVKQGGLENEDQVGLLCRQMLNIYAAEVRHKVLDMIIKTMEMDYLRLFIVHHGLHILWVWMVEANDTEMKVAILNLLRILPVTNKTILTKLKVWNMVERWARNDSELVIEPELSQDEGKDDIGGEDVDMKEDTKSQDKEGEAVSAEEEENDEANKIISTQDNGDVGANPDALVDEIVDEKPAESEEIDPKKKTVGTIARMLLEQWKDLPEIFRIPRAPKRKPEEEEEDVEKENQPEEPEDEKNDDQYSHRHHHRHRHRRYHHHHHRHHQSYRKKFRRYNDNWNEPKGMESNRIEVITTNRNDDDVVTDESLNGEDNQDLSAVIEIPCQDIDNYEETMAAEESQKAVFYRITFLADALSICTNTDVPIEEVASMFPQIKYDSDIGWMYEDGDVIDLEEYQKSLDSFVFLIQCIIEAEEESRPLDLRGLKTLYESSIIQLTDEEFNPLEHILHLFQQYQQQQQQSETEDAVDAEECLMPTEEDGENIEVNDAELEQPEERVVVEEGVEPDGGDKVCSQEYFEQTDVMVPDEVAQEYHAQQCPPAEEIDEIATVEMLDFELPLPAVAIDNIDYNQLEYEGDVDDLYGHMQPRTVDQIYPRAGVYYELPTGETIFVEVHDKAETTSIDLECGITVPLALDTTRKLTEKPLPPGWKYHCVDGQYYYYNKAKQVSQWHTPTHEEEMLRAEAERRRVEAEEEERLRAEADAERLKFESAVQESIEAQAMAANGGDQAELQPEPESEERLEEPEPELQAPPESEAVEQQEIRQPPEPQQEVEPEPQEEVEHEPQEEVEPEPQQEIELESQGEIEPEPQQEIQPQPEPQQEIEPQPQQEFEHEPQQEIEPEPQQEFEPEPQQEFESEPQHQPEVYQEPEQWMSQENGHNFDNETFDDREVLMTTTTSSSKRKNIEQFKSQVSQFIVRCLNPFRRRDCQHARICNDNDFKYLARKLSHSVYGKEIKACKHADELAFNELMMRKSKEYVKRYMKQFGERYDRNKSWEG